MQVGSVKRKCLILEQAIVSVDTTYTCGVQTQLKEIVKQKETII